MMPPTSLKDFNAFVAAGCEWDGDGPGGPVTPPGQVDFPEGPDGGKGRGQGELPDLSGGNGGPGTPSNTRSEAVPEPRTWVLMCLGMALLVALHRAMSLSPARARAGSRRA